MKDEFTKLAKRAGNVSALILLNAGHGNPNRIATLWKNAKLTIFVRRLYFSLREDG